MESAFKKYDEMLKKKYDKFVEKNMPRGVNAKRSNLWLGTCLATVAEGLYTSYIDWNPVVRVAAHFTGALAIPAAGAFVSSFALSAIEKTANLGIHLYNKKHPEKEKEDFKINPKVKNIIKFLSTATVGIAYAYGTLCYEMDCFANTGIFQAGQYTADIVGSLAGIVTFNKLEPNEILASFIHKASKLLNVTGKPVEKTKTPNKDNDVEMSTNIAKQEVSNNVGLEKQNKLLSGDLKKYIRWNKSPNNKGFLLTTTNEKTKPRNYEKKSKTHAKMNSKEYDNNSMEI